VDRLVRAGAAPAEQWRGFFHGFLAGAGAEADSIGPVFRRLEAFHRRHHLWNHPEPEAVRALAALAGLGYRVAAVSNSDGRAEDLLAGLGLAREFEFVVDSAQVGIEKPDPRIFRLACARLGLAPERCAYVGDLVSVDVEGAAAAGLLPVLCDHYGSYAPAEVPAGVPHARHPDELVSALRDLGSGRGPGAP
jgi:HAD superfamily hydrolase (TIGR01662 family)